MRRFLFVISATLLTYVSTTPLLAQHSASHSGTSSHITSGYTGIVRSTRAPGVTSGATAPIQPTGIGLQTYYSGYTGIAPGAIQNSRRGSGRGGYRSGIYGGYPFYVSTYDDYSEPFYYNAPGQAQDLAAQNAEVTANILGEEVNRLNAEVADLRQQQQSVPPPYLAANPYQQSTSQPQLPEQPITLVLANGSKIIMESYAVMNQTFWDFSKQPARKIAFGSVNMELSRKATEDAGGEFPELR